MMGISTYSRYRLQTEVQQPASRMSSLCLGTDCWYVLIKRLGGPRRSSDPCDGDKNQNAPYSNKTVNAYFIFGRFQIGISSQRPAFLTDVTWYSSAPTGKCLDIKLKHTATTSFRSLSNSSLVTSSLKITRQPSSSYTAKLRNSVKQRPSWAADSTWARQDRWKNWKNQEHLITGGFQV
jgi:hypothetical protein